MKLVTYLHDGIASLGIFAETRLYNLNQLNSRMPLNMLKFLEGGEKNMEIARLAELAALRYPDFYHPVTDYKLLAPLPNPPSCRDGYAFRQHVAAARRNRGLPMISEFDQYPIFYFTNHRSIMGPGEIPCMPDHFDKLDFELEIAAVIGKHGRNIKASEADQYIAGFTIMNDMSARTLQMEEMLLNLGPAKGKDFATVIGPWLVTPDELESCLCDPKFGHVGNNYQLSMKCRVNGIQVSKGSVADMDWTFAEIIERASYGVDLYPGDIIGSGTVGTGCFLELNGTGRLNNGDYQPQWLQAGDEIELEISGIGVLSNTIVAEASDWSIMALKKQQFKVV